MQTTTYTVAEANKSHDADVRAVLFKDGVQQDTALNVTGGSVSVDASAAVRRRCKLNLAGYHPEVDPFTCEVQLLRSINGEDVPLGVFRIEDPEFDETRDGIVTQLEGYDRAYWIASLRLTQPYSVTGGTALHTAISDLLLSRAPSLPLDFTPSTYTVSAATFDEQADPWEKALLMAESGGMELFFDANGVCVLRPVIVAVASNVVATFGNEARILRANKKTRTKNVRSRGIVVGENPNLATPVRSEAVDDDPASPTYYLGSFGDRPTWLRSQFIATQAQCDAAALALLRRSSGRALAVSIDGLVNPAFDASDVIAVVRSSLDLNVVMVVDTIDIPLSLKAPMRLTTREQKVS